MLAELVLKDRRPAAHVPIYRLEAELLKLPQVDMPVEHDHCAGLYARTIHIPAGTALTGAVHRHECFFVVRSGEIVVTSDAGVVLLKAGQMVVSAAGSKRAGVALTDCVVTTFHANPTDERDPQAMWSMFTDDKPCALGHEHREVLE